MMMMMMMNETVLDIGLSSTTTFRVLQLEPWMNHFDQMSFTIFQPPASHLIRMTMANGMQHLGK
jgi:hypothetical protein